MEVAKCAKCGRLANLEWLQARLKDGNWLKRCTHPECQNLDNWKPEN